MSNCCMRHHLGNQLTMEPEQRMCAGKLELNKLDSSFDKDWQASAKTISRSESLVRAEYNSSTSRLKESQQFWMHLFLSNQLIKR